jgi:electron transport complex protein RnfB
MDGPKRVNAEALDAVLPQTQCRMCGHVGCRAYADAMVRGEAAADQCPPGGDAVAHELARLLGVEFRSVNPRYGATKQRALAFIDEDLCIGCMLCIHACPVDAIVGSAKLMHTVLAADCTGCELCVAPCPVDCIAMIPAPSLDDEQRAFAAAHARALFERRQARLEPSRRSTVSSSIQDAKQRIIEQVVERARRRLAQRRPAD